MQVKALTWNVFHGRDFPPEESLRTKRSRWLRLPERDTTHIGVNRDLTEEFTEVIAGADWDVALFQECPPRWAKPLAARCRAEAHRSLTSRNSLAILRRLGAALNSDLIGSNEGGSNLTLVRDSAGAIVDRAEIVLSPGPDPERRTMALTRLESGLCLANLHASAGPPLREVAELELVLAAREAAAFAGDDPLILGGDLNVRPRESVVFGRLAGDFNLKGPTNDRSLDHLLARGLERVTPSVAWEPERREVTDHASGLRIRLSDHAPVEASFQVG